MNAIWWNTAGRSSPATRSRAPSASWRGFRARTTARSCARSCWQTSLHLDLGVRDDLTRFRHLAADIGCELIGGSADRLEPQLVETLLHVRERQHLRHIGLQDVGNIRRQVFRPPQAIPRYEIEAVHARFGDYRNLGRYGSPFRAGQRERFDLAAAGKRQRREHGV